MTRARRTGGEGSSVSFFMINRGQKKAVWLKAIFYTTRDDEKNVLVRLLSYDQGNYHRTLGHVISRR